MPSKYHSLLPLPPCSPLKRQSVRTFTSSSSKQPGKDLVLTPPPLVLCLSDSFPTHISHFFLPPHRHAARLEPSRCRGAARSPPRPALSGREVPGQLRKSPWPRPFPLLVPPLPPEIPSPPLKECTLSGAVRAPPAPLLCGGCPGRGVRAAEPLRPSRTGRARRRRGPGLGDGLGAGGRQGKVSKRRRRGGEGRWGDCPACADSCSRPSCVPARAA
ncbi:WAS/WASL-interacting protein family member 3-like [Onychostruthus taczanowskii]|uniref:WAS/WASL-interacting protein family member 3-like n=1 Tax=Onychostruthus taczanowskii TaxID=356909 RepID=UPI001B809F56|nr:WAS/WASL-interacting protein family member 3-like [Onychostruthus taczanowskii]